MTISIYPPPPSTLFLREMPSLDHLAPFPFLNLSFRETVITSSLSLYPGASRFPQKYSRSLLNVSPSSSSRRLHPTASTMCSKGPFRSLLCLICNRPSISFFLLPPKFPLFTRQGWSMFLLVDTFFLRCKRMHRAGTSLFILLRRTVYSHPLP